MERAPPLPAVVKLVLPFLEVKEVEDVLSVACSWFSRADVSSLLVDGLPRLEVWHTASSLAKSVPSELLPCCTSIRHLKCTSGGDNGEEEEEKEEAEAAGPEGKVLKLVRLFSATLVRLDLPDMYAPPADTFISQLMEEAPRLAYFSVGCRYLKEWNIFTELPRCCPGLRGIEFRAYLSSFNLQSLGTCRHLEEFSASEVEDSPPYVIADFIRDVGRHIRVWKCTIENTVEEFARLFPLLECVSVDFEEALLPALYALPHLRRVETFLVVHDLTGVSEDIMTRLELTLHVDYYSSVETAGRVHEALLTQFARDLHAVMGRNGTVGPIHKRECVHTEEGMSYVFHEMTLRVPIGDASFAELNASGMMVSDTFELTIRL